MRAYMAVCKDCPCEIASTAEYVKIESELESVLERLKNLKLQN